jgi:PhzF family phenazine biosynthesis protein
VRSVQVECRSGILPIQVRRDERGAEVRMGLPRVDVSVLENPSTAIRALGITPAQVPDPLPALVGPPYILVPLESLKAHRDLVPDMESIRQVTETAGCDGLIAASLETFDVGSAVHVRMFAPAAGIDEDPVTGSAQALVAAWLARTGFFDGKAAAPPDPPRFRVLGDGRVSYVAEQGEFTGRPGRIGVEARLAEEDGRSRVLEVAIIGRAVTVMQGEMAIPLR